jgi:flagellar basal-body rod modification protein FlgD
MDFSSLNVSSSTGSTASAGATGANGTTTNGEDRFLKLLVAQMRNQDPLNPMDNAQVTSQMAQIQTVSGVEKLNTTVAGLNGQFAQLQALSGASLVGRGVLVEGKRMDVQDGQGRAGFELASQADHVKVEVLSSAGRVIDTLNLGALPSGRHGLDWTPPAGVDPTQAATFRVSATLGSTAVAATTLTHDHVEAVSSGPEGLTLELASGGLLPYDKVKAFD